MYTMPDRQAMVWLYLTAACAVTPIVLNLPWWLNLVFTLCIGWRYASDHRGWIRPGRLLRLLLLVVVVVAVYRQYGTILGRNAGIALLVGLLGLKLLELRNARDYLLSLFLFYLVLLGAYLQEQAPWLGVWTLVTITVSLVAMLQLNQPQGLALRERLRLAGTLLAKALPLMLVVYLLFPRIQGTLWGLPVDAHGALTGLSEIMRPGSINSLGESTTPAFRVTFEGAMPSPRELYWRGLVLTDTDGQSWSRRRTSPAEPESFHALGEPVRYTVTLEPSNKPWMPALDLPAELPMGARAQPGYTFEHPTPVRERLTYTLSSHTRYRTPPIEIEERASALQLPDELSPRVQALAQRWQREHPEPRAIAQQALAHFRNENFVYTLKPPLLGQDPVDEFLFITRRGFCEHYAAAFVTLMRAAGVPTRVINGYQGGEVNSAGNYLVVRNSDAHAWAEIWVPNDGWVRVDPTSAIAPERVELGIDALRRLEARGVAPGSLPAAAVLRAIELGWFEGAWRHAGWYWDIANFNWHRWVADYGKARQERFLKNFGIQNVSWEKLLALLVGGAALVLLAYVAWQWRRPWMRDPVQRQYLRFCRKLARIGLVRAPHEGALDFARRCLTKRVDLQPAIEDITAKYLRLRYDRAANEEEWRAFKREVAAFHP